MMQALFFFCFENSFFFYSKLHVCCTKEQPSKSESVFFCTHIDKNYFLTKICDLFFFCVFAIIKNFNIHILTVLKVSVIVKSGIFIFFNRRTFYKILILKKKTMKNPITFPKKKKPRKEFFWLFDLEFEDISGSSDPLQLETGILHHFVANSTLQTEYTDLQLPT